MEILDVVRAWHSADGATIYLRVETADGVIDIEGSRAALEKIAAVIARHAARGRELQSGITMTTPADGVAYNASREGAHVLSVRHRDGLQIHYELERSQVETLRAQLEGL